MADQPGFPREQAWAIVTEYVQNDGLRKHMLAVEAAMRAYAVRYSEDPEQWGVIGLLHDFDWEIHSDLTTHPAKGAPILRERGVPEWMIQDILSHADFLNLPRDTTLRKTLAAVDELTGLIMATALVRPSKSIYDVDVRSLRKRWKDKAFARGVNREDIDRGAEALGIPIDEHVGIVLVAMQGIAPALGVEGVRRDIDLHLMGVAVKLVLFDIDGTLLHAGGAGVTATRQSLRDFYGVESLPPDYSMAGKIDTQIVLELVAHAGLVMDDAKARLTDYWQAYTVELARILPTYTVLSLPGVSELLTALTGNPEVVVGLLTGNLEAAARLKLEAAGIDPMQFRLAAYGHEADTRDGLPPLAVARARDSLGHIFEGDNIIIIGDTPADITCGESLGVRTIGVGTGRYSVDDLRAAGADYAFADLSDTQAVLDAILE